MERRSSPRRAPHWVLRPLFGLLAIVALCAVAGCSGTPSTLTTGQIDAMSFGRICFSPENTDRIELEGCWPISDADGAGFQQGDCVEARIPEDSNDPVTDIRHLDRECHVGVQLEPSTSQAIQTALWFAGTGAVIVFIGVILPRIRKRRALERERLRLEQRAKPAAPVEVGEPAEATVIDVNELGRHRSDD